MSEDFPNLLASVEAADAELLLRCEIGGDLLTGISNNFIARDVEDSVANLHEEQLMGGSSGEAVMVQQGIESETRDDFIFDIFEDDEDNGCILPDDSLCSEDDSDEGGVEAQLSAIGSIMAEDIQFEKPDEYSNTGEQDQITKRKRHLVGDNLPSCRESRTIGAVEIAMRGAASRKTKHIFEPIVGNTFDSAAEAYEFYNLYSWEVGFGICYGASDTNRGNKYRTMQELHCSNAGIDKRCNSHSQRSNCKARIRLLRTEDHGWYIRKVVKEHNHPLSESCGEKMQWYSHRRIDDSAKNMIKYLRDNNVPLGKVHSIMGSLYGSVQDLPSAASQRTDG
uniref:Uncharacterized protein n=1 Tax=Avena sativa TaxID=4498 RepID=A0ACD5XXW0_AVESA